MPEQYGGSGVDRLYSMILIEEQAYAMDSSTGFSLHSDIVANYINNFGNEEQKQNEPYRVCRRVNILRDYPDDKTNYTPEIRERAVQLLIESEKIILLLGQQSQLLLLKSVVLLKHCVFGI